MEKYNPIRVNHKEDMGVQVCNKVEKGGGRKEESDGFQIDLDTLFSIF